MAAFFSNLRNTVIAGVVLALIVFSIHFEMQGGSLTVVFWLYLVRWLHVIAGVMWIGLLWYFNFVATPTMPDPDLIPSLLAASDVLGTGWFAAKAAEVGPGKTVAVIGDGAVGLLAVLAAKELGAERIIAMKTSLAPR